MEKDKKIDVVLFDFSGVLAEEGWKEGFHVIAEANGLSDHYLVWAAVDAAYATGYLLGKVPESTFWNELRKETGIRGDDASLSHEILSRFILRDWMLELVKRLRAEHLTVGIFCDHSNILDKLNAQFDFFKLFDHVFNSYHLGKGKREISLFDDIAGKLQTEPGRILLIDDDSRHIERAKQRGWKAIHYVDRDSLWVEMRKLLPFTGTT